MNVRIAAIALFVAAGAVAQAQISTSEEPIQQAFEVLRGAKEVMLELDGTEKIGTRTNALYSNAFFQWDPNSIDSFAKVEVNDYLNGAHQRRMVGDGLNLWAYSFPRNVYSSLRYGSYSGPEPAGFRANMFEEVTTQSQANTVYLSRLLREVFSGDFAQYRTWFPSATVSVVGKNQTMVDPVITNRTYAGSDTDLFIVYTYPNNRPMRSGAFHLVRADISAKWSVSEVYYGDVVSFNASSSRVVDWKITVYTSSFPVTTNYVFVPPTTARPIANLKGQGG